MVLEGKPNIAVRSKNLFSIVGIGQRVTITGLKSRADLNGKTGSVVSRTDNGRLVVAVGGEVDILYSLKRQNLKTKHEMDLVSAPQAACAPTSNPRVSP